MIRLLVRGALVRGEALKLEGTQAHYLTRVMRLTAGDELSLFNGLDGEWRAVVVEVGKRRCALRPLVLTRPQMIGPDLDLIIALVKRARLETIVEKAAELGVRRIILAITERTNADHTNVERLGAIAVEASEQTGRLEAPEVRAPVKLAEILGDWPSPRRLMFCDEAGEADSVAEAMAGAKRGPWAVLIGPEGGFSAAERASVRALGATVPVSLGPRILRADTAAIAALTLWQSELGDWRGA